MKQVIRSEHAANQGLSDWHNSQCSPWMIPAPERPPRKKESWLIRTLAIILARVFGL